MTASGQTTFLCQQAAEKALKCVILKHKSRLVSGHGLLYLCKLVQEIDRNFRSNAKDCAYLNQFYIETRYPSDEPMVLTSKETEECLSIARKLIEQL